MSLFDVDTSNGNRQSPAPNKVDQISADARMSHGTSGVTYKVNNTNGGRVSTKDTRITANDGISDVAIFGQQDDGTINLKFFDTNGVGIAQFGQYPDGRVLLKIAPAGVEVSTATDAQLIFNSGQDIFKIVYASPIIPIPGVVGTTSTVTIAHGLTFTPAILAYLQIGGLYGPTPGVNVNTSTGVVTSVISVEVDATNVYITAIYPGAVSVPAGNTVKYYLLQESAT